MGIFFTSSNSVLPTTTNAFRESLLADARTLGDIDKEAAHRTVQLYKAVSPTFNPWRFAGAVVIAIVLLLAAIWAGQHNLPDISKSLMTSFSGFSGLVLGLLGGEAQKTGT